jgi:hypothetical protein
MFTYMVPDPNESEKPDDSQQSEQPAPQINPLLALHAMLQEGPRNPISEIPTRVLVALNFVKMCNDYTGYWGMLGGNHRKTRMVVRTLEIPGAQQGAMDRACVCLGRYFDGQDVDEPPDYLLDEEDFTDVPGSSPEPNGGSGY